METYGYVEHLTHDVAGFAVADATATGPRPHDDLIWVGTTDGLSGRWLLPEDALALAEAIAKTACSNIERRRLAAQEHQAHAQDGASALSGVGSPLAPLAPLSFNGFPTARFKLINPIGRFELDPDFAMKWLQMMANYSLAPELAQAARQMALSQAQKSRPLTLMGLILLWRPVPELRDFAETLYWSAMPWPTPRQDEYPCQE